MFQHPTIEINIFGTIGPPPRPEVIEGIDQETGQRWIVVFIGVQVGPKPANDNAALEVAA